MAVPDGHFNVKHDCEMLRVGRQCQKDAPKLPSGASVDNMFCMEVRGKSHYLLASYQQELM